MEMISRNKNIAIKLRLRGKSLREIHQALQIPKSTLSGWFKNIILTKPQIQKLEYKKRLGLKNARQKAALVHTKNKKLRINILQTEIDTLLKENIIDNKTLHLIALSALYLGEGFKKTAGTGLGNTDPLIIKFFIKSLETLFQLNRNNLHYRLHLRMDQNEEQMIEYWSQELKVSKNLFNKSVFDRRTLNKTTYTKYKGVCVVTCGNVAIQRKLMYLSEQYCHRIINQTMDD